MKYKLGCKLRQMVMDKYKETLYIEDSITNLKPAK